MKPKYAKFDVAFEKRFKKYVDRMTKTEKLQLKKRLAIFKENIFDKKLRTHKLKGELTGYYSFSVRYSDRIIFKILDDEGIYSWKSVAMMFATNPFKRYLRPITRSIPLSMSAGDGGQPCMYALTGMTLPTLPSEA